MPYRETLSRPRCFVVANDNRQLVELTILRYFLSPMQKAGSNPADTSTRKIKLL